jgi:hypothetical protein
MAECSECGTKVSWWFDGENDICNSCFDSNHDANAASIRSIRSFRE